MSSESLYQYLCVKPVWNDMQPRMADLRRYGALCKTVVEFGVRSGNSTACFLAGGAEVYSYDIIPPTFVCDPDAAARWHFEQTDTATLQAIPDCDLLLIDTAHNREQVRAELKHHASVRKFIVFHDVIKWGWGGEADLPGINYAIWDFLMEHPEWRVHEYLKDEWGLLILKRT